MMESELKQLVKWMVYEYAIGNNKKAKMILRIIQKHSNVVHDELSRRTKSESKLFECIEDKEDYRDISGYLSERILGLG